MLNMSKVVLVDRDDKELRVMDKLEAHKDGGKLHRAISVFLFRRANGKREILLQKRARKKPLWPMYWSNTVCTHPAKGETYLDCAVRRLKEEMGIKIEKSKLKLVYKLYYQADYDGVLSEHELDGIVVGEYSGDFEINSQEAAGAKWMGWEKLKKDVLKKPDLYTPWFKEVVEGGFNGS